MLTSNIDDAALASDVINNVKRQSRLQERLNQVLDGQPAPPSFYFVNEASTLNEEVGEPLLLQLENYVTAYPEIKTVILFITVFLAKPVAAAMEL